MNSIKLENNFYTISFFPIKMFQRDLVKLYKTTKILKLIESIGMRLFGLTTIKIHKFFIPELLFILKSFPNNKYSRLISEIENKTWFKNTLVSSNTNSLNLNNITKNMDFTLKNYQLDFIKTYVDKKNKYLLNGYILAFEQGLGKTLTALSLMESLSKDCVIIIAPKSTLNNVWSNEIDTFFRKKQNIYVVNDSKPTNSKFYIFNYESLDKIKDVFKYLKTKKNIGLIVDESHNFLHINSLRTKNLLHIRSLLNINDLLLMSGTPIKALGSEMIPILKLLDPMFDDDATDIFKKALGLNTTLATQILKNRMGMLMHRKMKHEVLNLPPKEEKILKIKIPNSDKYVIDNIQKDIIKFVEERTQYYLKNKKEYEKEFNEVIEFLKEKLNNDKDFLRYLTIINKLKEFGYNAKNKELVIDTKWANDYEKNILYKILTSELKKKFLNSKSVVKYVNLKIRGEVLGKLLVYLRAKMTSDMISHSNILNIINEAKKKTVIFTSFVESVEACDYYLKLNKLKPILIYGKTSNNIRQNLLLFKNNEESNPIVATMQTLSTGVTLTEANTVIFLNKPWRHTEYQQASDRVHRIGQDTNVYIYTMSLDTGLKPNLSDKMEDIMNWSKNMFDGIIGLNNTKVKI